MAILDMYALNAQFVAYFELPACVLFLKTYLWGVQLVESFSLGRWFGVPWALEARELASAPKSNAPGKEVPPWSEIEGAVWLETEGLSVSTRFGTSPGGHWSKKGL